jgi:hypothetical protein
MVNETEYLRTELPANRVSSVDISKVRLANGRTVIAEVSSITELMRYYSGRTARKK